MQRDGPVPFLFSGGLPVPSALQPYGRVSTFAHIVALVLAEAEPSKLFPSPSPRGRRSLSNEYLVFIPLGKAP